MSKYFSYCPDAGFETHDTEDEAKAAAQESIDDFRDYADDGWDENVTQICYGEIHGKTVKTVDRPVDPDNDTVSQDVDRIWDFGLKETTND